MKTKAPSLTHAVHTHSYLKYTNLLRVGIGPFVSQVKGELKVTLLGVLLMMTSEVMEANP